MNKKDISTYQIEPSRKIEIQNDTTKYESDIDSST